MAIANEWGYVLDCAFAEAGHDDGRDISGEIDLLEQLLNLIRALNKVDVLDLWSIG
jgi:hypothetical protein